MALTFHRLQPHSVAEVGPIDLRHGGARSSGTLGA
jgi:hypothetical protein